MVRSSPVLRAQGQPSSSEGEQHGSEPDLLWLAGLTGAHIGLGPICQDPEDRCSIWENLVSLVDFQCPGFPLTAEELCPYIDIPRTAPSSSSGAVPSAGTVTVPRAPAQPPPLPGSIDYRNNAHAKPPYSYATLICMAMQASKKPKITLAAICKWIRDNFCYFRRADPSWQSSIRHNLCINKRFIKVPREKGEPGRGAFWKLHPQYAEWLKSSTFEGRGALPEPTPGRRAQPGARRSPSPAASGCGSRGSLEVGAELQRLLREFEEFESSHEWNSLEEAAGQQRRQRSLLAGGASGGREEPGGLTQLQGSSEWEALLDIPPQQGEPCAPGHLQLPPCGQPGTLPLHPARARGQPQILPEPSPSNPGLDETLMATAFLEAAWPEEMRENLSSGIPMEQGAGNIQASLPEEDGMDWDSGPLETLLDMGDGR